MDGTQLILAALMGIVLQYAIIYFAVHNSRSEERQHAKIQTQLLVRMARQAGVPENEIQESLNIK